MAQDSMDPVDIRQPIYEVCLGDADIWPALALISGAGGLRPDEATAYDADMSFSGGFRAIISILPLVPLLSVYPLKKIACACISRDIVYIPPLLDPLILISFSRFYQTQAHHPHPAQILSSQQP